MQPKEKYKEKPTIYNKLPKLEVSIYFIGWISALFYILYEVYKTSIEYQNRNEFLVEGWSFIGLKKDDTDYIIGMAYEAITYIIFYGLLHYIMAEFLKSTCRKILPYYYFLFTISIIICYSSYKTGFVIILQALISFLVAYFGNKFYIWSYGLTAIITVYFLPENLIKWCNLEDSYFPMLMSILIWNNLRYLSFALHMNKTKSTKITYNDFVNFLGYYLYFPTVCHGPLLLYEDFQNVYNIEQIQESFYKRLLKFIASIIKYTGYLYLTIFLLHFLHYGLVFHLKYIQTSYSASQGLFWWAGYLFMLKHMIVFGLTISAAKAEGIKAPNPPQCIGKIALYSNMWKNFDQSMYWFKKRYIFEPFVNNSKSKLKQMLGSLLCFMFIIVWHGVRNEVIIWALLNHIEVLLEQLGKAFSKTELFLKIYGNCLNPRCLRRIAALFSVPLLCLSCISHYFFLGSDDIGQHHIERIIQEPYIINAFVLFIAYCVCQVAIEIKMGEEKNKKVM